MIPLPVAAFAAGFVSFLYERRRNGFVQVSFLLPIVHALQKHFSLLIQLSSNQPH
jgi:hypothetical protein